MRRSLISTFSSKKATGKSDLFTLLIARRYLTVPPPTPTLTASSPFPSSSPTSSAQWGELSSDALDVFAEKAFGVTKASHGVTFSEMYSFCESDVALMLPSCGDNVTGIILCHPNSGAIRALKMAQLRDQEEKEKEGLDKTLSGKEEQTKQRALSCVRENLRTFARIGSGGGSTTDTINSCGACAVINVLGNVPATTTGSEEEEEEIGKGLLPSDIAEATAALQTQTHITTNTEKPTVSAEGTQPLSLANKEVTFKRVFEANQFVAAQCGPQSSSGGEARGRYHYTAFIAVSPSSSRHAIKEKEGEKSLLSHPSLSSTCGDRPLIVELDSSLPAPLVWGECDEARGRCFISATGDILQRYFDAAGSIDFSAVAVSVETKKKEV